MPSYSRDPAKLERLARMSGPRARAALPARPAVCHCSDDASAKRVVARLIREIGFEPVDCGALMVARYLEPFALLVTELAYNKRGRPEVGVRFMRPDRRRGAARR